MGTKVVPFDLVPHGHQSSALFVKIGTVFFNIEEAIDQFEIDIFLGLPDTLSQYSIFQQAKFKRALLPIRFTS